MIFLNIAKITNNYSLIQTGGVSNLPSIDAYKTVITDAVYEVLFSYDNVYYTHCYHETMKSYNQAGSLIDTTRIYKQAIGG